MEETREYREFAMVVERTGNEAILHVFGDVDLSCASEFEKAIEQAALTSDTVTIDLQKCQYMDSAGLTTLVRAAQRDDARVEAIVLVGSSVARLTEITEFSRVLPIRYVPGPRLATDGRQTHSVCT